MRLSPTAQARIHQLTQVFEHIAQTRMQGLGLLHPGLRVQALGFAEAHEPDGPVWLQGVLITPWFMNLVRLPLVRAQALAPGVVAARRFATQQCDFIGAHEAALGGFEVCSLFSPMTEFADQTAAVLTGHEVLRQMSQAVEQASTPGAAPSSSSLQALASTPGPASSASPQPSRRGFLLGRPAVGRALP